MFQAAPKKYDVLQSTWTAASGMRAIPTQDRAGIQRLGQRTRRSANALARRCYPLVSIPAFLIVSLFVSAALILAVVGLIIAAALRLPIRVATTLVLRASRSIYPKQSLS